MRNVLELTVQRTSLYIFLALSIMLYPGCDSGVKAKIAEVPASKVVAQEKAPSPPIADAATILHRPEVPILCYHQIRDFKPTDSHTAKDYIVPVTNFREQMKLLADSGYHSI